MDGRVKTITTPLIILGLLLAPVLGVGIWARVRGTATDYAEAGLIGLSIAFGFFAVGHFVRTAPMSEMLPPWVPNRVVLIYATGALEIFLALALMVQKSRRLAGWACIAVLVLFFPANIYAAFNKVGMGGHLWGPVYLFVRTPLQIILIVWTYWFAIRSQTNERSG